jgi:hypothetical protein
MRIEELYSKYGNWSATALQLGKTLSAINYWRKIGYIPYPAQLVIEKKTKGLFKARMEDATPKTKR